MLPQNLLLVAWRDELGARVRPRYLSERDEVWVRAALAEFDAWVGRTAGERDKELPRRIETIARDHGISPRAAAGMAHVLARRFKTQVAAALEPARVRAIAFEESAQGDVFDREAALARAAERLSISARDVLTALFADRPQSRRIVAPLEPLSTASSVEAYNLALVQGLLLRSELVSVEVSEHVRAVVRFAKLAGLLCTYSHGARGTRLELSGPLSLLRHTTKYGFALASFFPAVVATPGFRLEARCVLGAEPLVVEVGAADRIARTHALPKDADSALERALARDVRRLGTRWTLLRESEALAAGRHSFFPDFTLRHDSGFSVLVEVVGFYTPEYLRSKLQALRASAERPLIACVDETLACGEGDLPGPLLRFKKRIDAAALIEAAERLRARPDLG